LQHRAELERIMREWSWVRCDWRIRKDPNGGFGRGEGRYKRLYI
jgi:hypothetical protein